MTDKKTDKRRVALLTGITGQVCLFVFVRLVNSEKTSCRLNCGLIIALLTVKCLPHISWLSWTYLKRLSLRILEFRKYSYRNHNLGAYVYLLVPKYWKPLILVAIWFNTPGTLIAITLYSTVIITWNKELENIAIERIIGPLFTTSHIKSGLSLIVRVNVSSCP